MPVAPALLATDEPAAELPDELPLLFEPEVPDELPLPLPLELLPVGAATPAAATLAPVGYGAIALDATPDAAQSLLAPLELKSLMFAQAIRVVFKS